MSKKQQDLNFDKKYYSELSEGRFNITAPQAANGEIVKNLHEVLLSKFRDLPFTDFKRSKSEYPVEFDETYRIYVLYSRANQLKQSTDLISDYFGYRDAVGNSIQVKIAIEKK